jgi:hypothetical protein
MKFFPYILSTLPVSMSLLNSKTIMLLALVAISSWNFPWGVALDVGLVSVYVIVKRKKAPGAAAHVKVSPGQVTTGDESIKLLAMAMLSDRVDASGTAATTSLGLPPVPSKRAALPRNRTPVDERAARLRLLE